MSGFLCSLSQWTEKAYLQLWKHIFLIKSKGTGSLLVLCGKTHGGWFHFYCQKNIRKWKPVPPTKAALAGRPLLQREGFSQTGEQATSQSSAPPEDRARRPAWTWWRSSFCAAEHCYSGLPFCSDHWIWFMWVDVSKVVCGQRSCLPFIQTAPHTPVLSPRLQHMDMSAKVLSDCLVALLTLPIPTHWIKYFGSGYLS